MMWGFNDGFGWWMIFGGLWMIAFWAIIIGLVVWGVSKIAGGSRRAETGETPLDIAQKRLARGEITREQFDELKQALR